MFSQFDKPWKAQNVCAAADPHLQGSENGFIPLGVSVVDQKHKCKVTVQIPYVIFKISKFQK